MAQLDSICEVLDTMTQSLIGSTYSIKCITDGKDTVFVNCVDQLLQNVQNQNKIADIIISAVSSHHRCYMCSCKTLLTLILAWTKVIGNLRRQDVPLAVVLGTFHQAVMLSVKHADDICVKPKDIQKPNKRCQKETVSSHRLSTVTGSLSADIKTSEATDDEILSKQGSAACRKHKNKEQLDFHAVMDNVYGHRPEHSLSPNSAVQSLLAVGQSICDSDNPNADVDDVSWFFEDETMMLSGAKMKVQNESKDESGINHFLPNNSFNFQELRIESQHPSLLNQVIDNCMLEPNATQGVGEISSLQDCIDDSDEFDSCFNEDLKPETLEDCDQKTTYAGGDIISKKYEAFSKNRVDDDGYKNNGDGDDDDNDEFGSCYKEDSSSLDLPLHVLTNKLAYTETWSPATTDDNFSATLLLESRLKEVLKNSPKEDLKMRVFNRCRHFTTIKSTVCELQQSLNHEHEQSKWSTDQKISSDHEEETMKVSPVLDKQSTKALNDLQSSAGIHLRHLFSDSQKQSEHVKHLQNFTADYRAIQISSSKTDCCTSSAYIGKDSVNHTGIQRDGRNILLWKLTKLLSHGAEEVVPLAANVCWNQMKEKKTSLLSSIRLSSIHTHTVVGPVWEHSSVVDGAVLNTTTTQLTVLSRLSGPYRVLLIHGDLQLSYKHKGQQVKQNQRTIRKQPMVESKEAVWLKELESIIRELSVQVLLVSGITSDSVLDLCDNMDIVLVTKVPYSLLVMLGEACQVHYVKYITEATEANVLYPLMVDPYNSEWRDKISASDNSQLVVIRMSTPLIQTCVMCHPCQNVVMLREEQFWHCVYRLASCIHSNKMLPGGGATELSCAVQLRRHADKLEANDNTSVQYEGLMYHAVAEGFEQFTSVVSRNTVSNTESDLTAAKLFDSEGIITENTDPVCQVFDDFESKVEAWQTACHVTCQLLLTDVEITTGLDVLDKEIII